MMYTNSTFEEGGGGGATHQRLFEQTLHTWQSVRAPYTYEQWDVARWIDLVRYDNNERVGGELNRLMMFSKWFGFNKIRECVS